MNKRRLTVPWPPLYRPFHGQIELCQISAMGSLRKVKDMRNSNEVGWQFTLRKVVLVTQEVFLHENSSRIDEQTVVSLVFTSVWPPFTCLETDAGNWTERKLA